MRRIFSTIVAACLLVGLAGFAEAHGIRVRSGYRPHRVYHGYYYGPRPYVRRYYPRRVYDPPYYYDRYYYDRFYDGYYDDFYYPEPGFSIRIGNY